MRKRGWVVGAVAVGVLGGCFRMRVVGVREKVVEREEEVVAVEGCLGDTFKRIGMRDAYPPGDVNADGCCDVRDLLLVVAAWGPAKEEYGMWLFDLNQDGMVDVVDLLEVTREWSE